MRRLKSFCIVGHGQISIEDYGEKCRLELRTAEESRLQIKSAGVDVVSANGDLLEHYPLVHIYKLTFKEER